MRSKFPSLKSLKEFYPDFNPFYSQSWVYSGIISYFGQLDRFDELEFTQTKEEIDFVIYDYQGNHGFFGKPGFLPGSNYHGLVFEGHVDYWTEKPIPPGTILISGHTHFEQTPTYTSVGFDYWDIFLYNEYRGGAMYSQINRSSVRDAEYDIVIPVGTPREHRLTFMNNLVERRADLTIVTDDRQAVLDTDLRFSNLGIEVYLNKVGLKKYQPYYFSPSIYDVNNQRSLDHMPHRKMHSIARVNVILETTMYNTLTPYCTEKTWKVLAQHRPFVVFGDTNILKKLQEQGFKTFDRYCDESYDTIVDPTEKGIRVIEAMKQLVDSCKKYPDEIDSICRHNQELFFSQERHANNLATFGKRFLEIVK